MKWSHFCAGAVFALAASGFATAATAAESGGSEPATETPQQKVWHEAVAAMQKGPTSVPLLSEATLDLPKGYAYVPKAQGIKLMETMGNQTDDRFLGLIFPEAEDQTWFATLEYQHDGHIADDEAKDWKADELLKSLKEGTAEGNKFREKQGAKPIELTGWIEKPAYEAGSHRLVWSVGVQDIGAKVGEEASVNYNTYVLGREGYISMDFITSTGKIESEKAIAKELLASIRFNNGRAYADFKPSTDKVAAYGLAALVGGVALKKLGLLALAGAFFAKFIKVILLAGAALVAGARKFFKRGG